MTFFISSGFLTAQIDFYQQSQKIKQLILEHWKKNPDFYTAYNLREILHYLGRRYLRLSPESLNKVLSLTIMYNDDKELFPYYQKLHNRHFKPPLPLSHPSAPARNAIERLMLAALYPDSLNFCAYLNIAENEMWDLSNESFVRHIAHVALAIQWVQSFMPDTPYCINSQRLLNYRNRLLERLAKVKAGSDSWMEGILALYWLNTPKNLLPDVLSVLEKVQCPSGAFRWNPHAEECNAAHEHPTLLALWIICLEEANGYIYSWIWPEE
jgi:hypothetical protein